MTDILLDPPARGARSRYRKVRERGAFDFALAGAAIVLAIADGKAQAARIVLSGVAPIPWRSTAAEQAIVGKTLGCRDHRSRGGSGSQKRGGTGRERLQNPARPRHRRRDAHNARDVAICTAAGSKYPIGPALVHAPPNLTALASKRTSNTPGRARFEECR